MDVNDKRIDFIGVGIERSATSWLFECLREHPQICGAKYKETDFFKDDEKYAKGIKYYYSFFDHCPSNSVKGEFSPRYFFNKKIPKRIYDACPDAKIIICLRNPIEKTYSLYHMKKSYKSLPHKNFEEFIHDKRYIQRGFYSLILEKYFTLFPRKNILILFYEEMKKNPIAFLRSVYRFLGVDEFFVPKLLNTVHNSPESRGLFRSLLTTVLSKIRRKILMKFVLGKKFVHYVQTTGMYGRLECYLAKSSKKKKKRRPIKPKTKKYLNALFENEINKLEKILNKDLSFWK